MPASEVLGDCDECRIGMNRRRHAQNERQCNFHE
jgi:hypothetical protein